MITELILATALALLACWAGYLHGQLRAARADKELHQRLHYDAVSEANARAKAAEDRLFNQLVLMRREGFTPVPEDEPWETHVLTPEMEADIERQRLGEE